MSAKSAEMTTDIGYDNITPEPIPRQHCRASIYDTEGQLTPAMMIIANIAELTIPDS